MSHRTSSWIICIAVGIALASVFSACALIETEETPTPQLTPTTESATPEPDDATAEELWQELQEVNYPETWSTVPGKGTLYPGQGPHGVLLSTYLNAEAAKALEAQPGVMPEGAVIVKENYTEDETLNSVTVMRKQSGFDPDHNDWYWVNYGADGAINASGQVDGCISCHGAVRSNDYIFTFLVAPIEADVVEPDEGVMTTVEELWQTLQDADYTEAWSTVPGKGTLYPGQVPHGALLTTYLNPEAAEALEAQPGVMPEGAIIVKENYTEDETLNSITVMRKQSGFDPDHNDWFWAGYGADGTIQAAGQAAGCISCHGAVRTNDYIFTFLVAPISPTGAPPETE